MHKEAMQWIAGCIGRMPTPKMVIEIGSRNVNGTARALFGPEVKYLGIDVAGGPGVDVIADGASYRHHGEVDCVICAEVLEHVMYPASIVANARLLVRNGGWVIITAACDPRKPHSAVDGGPLRAGEHYRNLTYDELSSMLTQFATAEIEVCKVRGDIRAVARR